MSLFAKRKGRRIATHDDDDDDGSGDASTPRADDTTASAQPTPAIRFGKRPSKPSSLRRSVVLGDSGDGDSTEGTLSTERPGNNTSSNRPIPEKHSDSDDDDDDGPVVVRPTTGRTGSSRAKKRQPAAASVTSAADDGAMEGVVTPDVARGPRRKVRAGAVSSSSSAASLAPRVLETNTFRKALSGALPSGIFLQDADDGAGVGGDDNSADDDRPRYSQAYLEELQSATPNRPRDLAQQDRRSGDAPPDGTDAMDLDLDPSELEGALVVDESELAPAQNAAAVPLPVGVAPPSPTARVLTAAEIQERKDRRARRALEQEAAALQLGSDDDEAIGYISLLPEDQKQKKRQQRKEETRLVREDEDLGEGFDQYVEDEQLAFGRKAERAARRQRKHDMEALINAAEADDEDTVTGGPGVGVGAGPDALTRTGGKADDSSDSEAERRAAYDAAQTRAGMGGGGMQARRLHTTTLDDGIGDGGGSSSRLPPDAAAALVVPKMSALPDLADCLARMQRTVQALADEAAAKRAKLAAVEREKAEIAAREAEVQAVLDAAAQKYQTVLGTKGAGATDGGAGSTPEGAAAAVRALASGDSSHSQSPLRAALPLGFGGGFPAERGLESLGATPVRPKADDAEETL